MRATYYTDKATDRVLNIEEYEALLKEANDLLSSVSSEKYTQAVVFLTSGGKMYSTLLLNALTEYKLKEKALIEKMSKANDTLIERIVAVWGKEGEIQPPFDLYRMLCVDVPSYDFRKMLLCLNPENKNAMMLLNGGKLGYIQKPIEVTIPKVK